MNYTQTSLTIGVLLFLLSLSYPILFWFAVLASAQYAVTMIVLFILFTKKLNHLKRQDEEQGK